MRIEVTLTAIKYPDQTKKTVAHNAFIEDDNLLLVPGAGSLLKVIQYLDGTKFVEYTTDFAFSGVATVLEAAAETGGHFILT